MPNVSFTSPEYQADASFQSANYCYRGDEHSGWLIERDGQQWLRLGPGYRLLPSFYCGVCATDLARHALPFSLPQITGHEVVAIQDEQYAAIEINATHAATGHDLETCPWCLAGLANHCPERLTLGIDRLPGGFAPWLLAPVNAIHPLPEGLAPHAGIFIEPLAAALQAVEISTPGPGDKVAVLGPRRLGMLILAVLAGYRAMHKLDFTITAVVRHAHLTEACQHAGADKVILLTPDSAPPESGFDLVFDTTGKEAGFVTALSMSRDRVHLKSTHGQIVLGINYLTDMVINEQSLCAFQASSSDQAGCLLIDQPEHIYLAESVAAEIRQTLQQDYPQSRLLQGPAKLMLEQLQAELAGADEPVIPRFDAAVVSTTTELDAVLRPDPKCFGSLLKPRGTICLSGASIQIESSELLNAVRNRQITLQTSRCGSFERAIQLLEQTPALMQLLETQFISHVMPLSEITPAFQLAADSRQSMKVVIKTGQTD